MSKNKFIVTVAVELESPATKTEVTRFVVAALNAAAQKPPTLQLKTARVRSVDFD